MVTYADYIENLKHEGYRPCVIGALCCNGFIGLSRSNKYPGWEFVQGGIAYSETPEEAIEREIVEEMGYWFYKNCHFPPKRVQFMFEDRMDTKVKEKLVTDAGELKAKGKHYLVYAVDLEFEDRMPEIEPDDFKFKGTTVKFHEQKWATYEEAKKLVKTIQNPVKRQIAFKAIELLNELGYSTK